MLGLTQFENIAPIYIGLQTTVYRARRVTDGQFVVIKTLRNNYPSFRELVQFRNQFVISSNLDSPHIVKPIALERHNNGYLLIMPDQGAISLKQYLSARETQNQENKDIDVNVDVNVNQAIATANPPQHQQLHQPRFVLQVALQLAIALCHLSTERVVHKDIKPANVLIHPDTGLVQLIDFSIASLLPKEQQEPVNPRGLEGTLTYIAPEQTGRMNRGIDYRSDFYSLGVTLYELLTGTPPFMASDPIELLNCHISQNPVAPAELQDEQGQAYPLMLSEIIMKLMAKNAEDRYQSALGLKHDLERCLQSLDRSGAIKPFVLGERDICDRFNIPEKLYGRAQDVVTLLGAFERVTHGKSEMMLVAGSSGIGKTAVVNEVHKPIVEKRGYFIKGKFDQFNRNIPCSAFVQAFRDLIGHLLSESDAELTQWKTQILAAVGSNGQVLIEVIPELESIIGPQPPIPDLFGGAAQNRFHLLFEQFIAVFATKSHPLVIFLDDLQWADSASLNLMQVLMEESKRGYLLLLGAYRDNEVFPTHPLMLSLDQMQKQGAFLQTLTLSPLDIADINALVADTLLCTQDIAQPLSQLVHQKTQGNPFFSTQFLWGLHEENYIHFNLEAGYWQCDLTQVRQLALTDDVVEFMVGRLQKLPEATQTVLKLAACVGNRFDLGTLAMVSGQSQTEVGRELWFSLQEGLVIPENETYKFFHGQQATLVQGDRLQISYRFLHDRVQQAAYALISEDQKQATHFKIGEQLWRNLSTQEQEEQLFTILNHLNVGASLITERAVCHEVAQLNLRASRKANGAVAYGASRRYCAAGQGYLDQQSWQDHYALAFDLAIATIEAEFFNHNVETAQQLSQELLERTETLLDQIRIYELQILFEINNNHMLAAIDLAINVLQRLDITLPQAPEDIQATVKKLRQAVALPIDAIAQLEDLEPITDATQLAAIRILTNANSAAYIANPSIYPMIALQTVQQCLQYGHSPLAASAYSWYGALLCGMYDEIEAGYEFGKLSLVLLEKFNARSLVAKVKNMFNVFIRPWQEPLVNALADLPQAIQGGFDNGDVEYAFYAIVHYCNYLFYSGECLDNVYQVQGRYLPEIIQAKYEFHAGFLRINQQAIANLLGENEQPQRLQGSILAGETCLAHWQENKLVFLVLCFYEAQTRLAYLFEDYDQALTAGEQGWQYRAAAMGTLYASEQNFYHSLALLTQAELTPDQRDRLTENQQQLQLWASHAPENFQHKYDLIEAEKDRVLNSADKTPAIEAYERAINGAQAQGYLHEEALANELAAKFYLSWDKHKIAATYMQEAYYCYARWGAKAKIQQLEDHYPELLTPILRQQQLEANIVDPFSTLTQSLTTSFKTQSLSANLTDVFDLSTILQCTQKLARTIDLEQLLQDIAEIILTNTNAQKIALLTPEKQQLQLQVYGEQQAEGKLAIQIQGRSLTPEKLLPIRLIQYVKNTQEMVAIDGAKTEIVGILAGYLLKYQPQSVLCVPLLNQGKLVAIAYLEHLTTRGIFTKSRQTMVEFLCAQAAVALQNAQLYHRAQQSQSRAETALAELQQAQLQIVQSEKMSALGNLVAGVAHEINNPVGFLRSNIPPAQGYIQDLLGLIDVYQAEYPEANDNIDQDIAAIDLDFVREDFPKLINSMNTGIDRIHSISNSLRTFSRQDQEHQTEFNLHDGIDSTLLILKHLTKANDQRPKIQVLKNYGELPPILCFPGQLNQVFMNILANAIDAFEKVNRGRTYAEIETNPNIITIQTEMTPQQVQIHIQDNGCGMNPDTIPRIFEQGFTTKEVGKGTGLGMAIAQQIITEKHGGHITCQSKLGQGTTFTISLPATV